MLGVALVGLSANLASAWLLFRKQSESLNVRGAFFHVLGDALGSIGAVLASLAIMFLGWFAADAVISAVVALLILWSSWVVIRDAVDILLESAPSNINLGKLKDQLVGARGVRSVHDLHVWTLTSGVVAMSCHVVVGPNGPVASEVLGAVQRIAHEVFQIDHTTIQIEGEGMDGEPVGCDCHFGAG
jgi:cobalt-zinc-cadmium efflux system protein